jgi:outer membrane autotransporter protein
MPNARLELQRKVQGDNRNINAALLADPTINGIAPLEPVDRNYGNFSVGASAVLPKGVSGFFNYERLFGRENFSNSKYTVGVRVEF